VKSIDWPTIKVGPTFLIQRPTIKVGPTFLIQRPTIKVGPTFSIQRPTMKVGPTEQVSAAEKKGERCSPYYMGRNYCTRDWAGTKTMPAACICGIIAASA
jgi:hypothetical protein